MYVYISPVLQYSWDQRDFAPALYTVNCSCFIILNYSFKKCVIIHLNVLRIEALINVTPTSRTSLNNQFFSFICSVNLLLKDNRAKEKHIVPYMMRKLIATQLIFGR